MKFLPQVSLVNNHLLPETLSAGTGMTNQAELNSRVGKIGHALSDLGPLGRAEIDGEVVEVSAEQGFIPKGEKVEVTAADGLGVQVKRVV